MIATLRNAYVTTFSRVENATSQWLPGLLIRFAFAAVLLVYYLNSFSTKIGAGPLGLFMISPNAYYQIVPPVIEAAGFDVAQVPLFWKLVVALGTYAEALLPILIVVGFATRLAALGMIGFITVQTVVDVFIHMIGPEATGAWFDRFSDAAILDQRLLWITLLALLAILGPGKFSADALLGRRFAATA